MILPADFSLMCRINYRKSCTYQKIALNDYNNMIAKFPAGTTVDALSYRANKMYGWSKIKSVHFDIETSTQNILTNKRGLSFKAPKQAIGLKFVTLPRGFFDSAGSSLKEKIFGTIASSFVKNFEIKGKDRTKKLSLYRLLMSSIVSTNSANVTLNGKTFNYAKYIDNIDILLMDYLDNIYDCPMDVYLTHKLICNRLLIPYIFGGKKFNGTNESIEVPMSSYWIFQLLYSRDNSVYFNALNNFKWGDVDITKLQTRLIRTYTKTNGAKLELRSSNVQPVVINNFAVRFIYE